jgi:hypothetical protein
MRSFSLGRNEDGAWEISNQNNVAEEVAPEVAPAAKEELNAEGLTGSEEELVSDNIPKAESSLEMKEIKLPSNLEASGYNFSESSHDGVTLESEFGDKIAFEASKLDNVQNIKPIFDGDQNIVRYDVSFADNTTKEFIPTELSAGETVYVEAPTEANMEAPSSEELNSALEESMTNLGQAQENAYEASSGLYNKNFESKDEFFDFLKESKGVESLSSTEEAILGRHYDRLMSTDGPPSANVQRAVSRDMEFFFTNRL